MTDKYTPEFEFEANTFSLVNNSDFREFLIENKVIVTVVGFVFASSMVKLIDSFFDHIMLVCKDDHIEEEERLKEINDISENTPPSIACGIIYYISHLCKLNLTKQDISLLCNISEVTINKVFKKLINYTSLLISENIQKMYNIKFKFKIIK